MKNIFRMIKDMFTSKSNVQNLNVQDFVKLYRDTPGAVLLDVRRPDEVSGGMLDGAVNIDYSDVGFLEKIKDLDKSQNYFLYCRSGRRSLNACQAMNEIGIGNVYNMGGGYLAYSEWNK